MKNVHVRMGISTFKDDNDNYNNNDHLKINLSESLYFHISSVETITVHTEHVLNK